MAGLRRYVGLRTVVATSAGLALATVSLTANVQLGLGLPGASGWLAIVVAGLIALLAAGCFSELIGLFPSAAGIKLFIEKAFGERAALVSASLYMTVIILIVGAESYILAQVLHYVLPAVPAWVWAVGFLSTVAAINMRGITLSALAQDIATGVMVLGVVALAAYALLQPGAPPVPTPLTVGDGFSFAQALALAVFLFLGFEWVTPLAEEVRDPRHIPRGMMIGVLVLVAVYSLLHVGMTTMVGKEELAGSPIPHILFGEAALGRVGLLAIVCISALASITSYNAGLLTASRFLYAMARDRAAPPVLARIHPDWATPYAAILTLYGICLSMVLYVLLTGQFLTFIFLGAAVECFIFVMMAAAVMRLRRSMPEAERPFTMVGGAWGAGLVALLYGLLGLLIFLPGDAGDAPAQRGALILLVTVGLLMTGYTFWGVPYLRRRWAIEQPTRRRRRPGGGGT